jgi:hypothetical protein
MLLAINIELLTQMVKLKSTITKMEVSDEQEQSYC